MSEEKQIGRDDLILVTGATGFIGPAVVESLLQHGFRNIRAMARPSSNMQRLEGIVKRCKDGARVEVILGNLLSREDCGRAARGVLLVIHLATSGDKSFPASFISSVVTTRNLLDATVREGVLRRFVNVSSFAVYANTQRSVLDENAPIEQPAHIRGDAYTFAKVKQDEVVMDYGKRFQVPYVIVRPGSVYGPGKEGITGRVGIDSFGVFLHMGGSNRIPLTYIDNCADAIVLAGITQGVEGQVFNIVDDDLPSSRQFLRMYKRNVRRFRSYYVPRVVSYGLCWAWEKYTAWSEEQLPPAFNRSRWRAEWKKTRYSNEKLKKMLRWTPKVSMADGLNRYFAGCREKFHA